jgi:hypothetical protein
MGHPVALVLFALIATIVVGTVALAWGFYRFLHSFDWSEQNWAASHILD